MTSAPTGIDPQLLRRACARFDERFGAGRDRRVAVAPGRVNLIGEHTDYNDGFVLPMAIGRAAVVVFRPRADRVLRGYSVAFDETKQLRARLARAARRQRLDLLRRRRRLGLRRPRGCPTRGLDLVVDGDVPIGAGLSSSAALELATARALADGRRRAVGRRAHGEARAEGRERLRRHELRDHGPVRLGRLRGGQGAAARLPLARDAAGAGARARRRRGDGHRRAPAARRQRLQRPPRRLRARRRRARAHAPRACARCAT